jgi:hypothetical protein
MTSAVRSHPTAQLRTLREREDIQGNVRQVLHRPTPGRLLLSPNLPILESPMPTANETPISRRRSSRAAGNSGVKPSPATRRSRGVRQPTPSVLADLDRMISALIKENRELQRQIDKLSRRALGATSGTVERALRSIQRRISSAVGGRATTRRRRSVPAAPVSRTPRKITDPAVLERRRQALAKARAARAAKRASALP